MHSLYKTSISLLLLALTLGFASSAVFAGENGLEAAQQVKAQYRNLFFAMTDVNGLGIASCDPDTGAPATGRGTIACIDVTYASDTAFKSALEVFNPPFQLDGVWIRFENIGPITTQPGVTVHN